MQAQERVRSQITKALDAEKRRLARERAAEAKQAAVEPAADTPAQQHKITQKIEISDEEAEAIIDDFVYGPMFTPPTVKGADGKPVSFASPKHFCRTCHDYAAVHIDCFECHASRPPAKTAASSEAAPAHAAKANAAVLAQYLRSLAQ